MFNNNFGSNNWKLPTREFIALSSYVNNNTGSDDFFNDPAYRIARTTFAGHYHRLKPHGQTYYRPVVKYIPQGLPEWTSSAHWNYLPILNNQKIYRSIHNLTSYNDDKQISQDPFARTYYFNG